MRYSQMFKTKNMNKYLIIAVMAIGTIGATRATSMAQDQVQTRKEERAQKHSDRQKHELNDTKAKLEKKQNKFDKKERKMHRKQRKINSQQRSVDRQTEVK
jgi:uncharacterized protein HemX